MTDEIKRVVLNQSVIDDTEAQLAGDVETKWIELREQDAAPPLPTDKVSGLLYILAADHKLRAKLSDGTVLDLTAAGAAPLTFKGTIGAAADFPDPADVAAGHVYHVTAAVVDNAGAGHTNTGLQFLAGDEIVWTTTWELLGPARTVRQISDADTPYTVVELDEILVTDTAGGILQVILPTPAAEFTGRKIRVVDGTGTAGTHTVTVIDLGAFTHIMRVAYEDIEVVCDGVAWHLVGNEEVVEALVHGVITGHVTATDAAPTVPTAEDNIIGCDTTGAADVLVNLDALAAYPDGKTLIIKDEGNNAHVNNVVITADGVEPIDGAPMPGGAITIAAASGVLRIYKRPTGWFTF